MTKDQEYRYILGTWTLSGFIFFGILAPIFWFFSEYFGLKPFELRDLFPLLGCVVAAFGFFGVGHASVRTAEESQVAQVARVVSVNREGDINIQ